MRLPFGLRDKMVLANEVFAFAGNIGAGIGALLAILGISSNFANNTSRVVFNVEVATLSLPVRMILVILIAAALGWGLGALVTWLSRSRNEALSFAVYVVAILWGGLIVGAADWLAVAMNRQILSETLLFTIVGMGLALWIAGFHFRNSNAAGKHALRLHCDALMLCSIGAALFMILTMLGAR